MYGVVIYLFRPLVLPLVGFVPSFCLSGFLSLVWYFVMELGCWLFLDVVI